MEVKEVGEDYAKIIRKAEDRLGDLTALIAVEASLRGIQAAVDGLIGEGSFERFVDSKDHRPRIEEIFTSLKKDNFEFVKLYNDLMDATVIVTSVESAKTASDEPFGPLTDKILERINSLEQKLCKTIDHKKHLLKLENKEVIGKKEPGDNSKDSERVHPEGS